MKTARLPVLVVVGLMAVSCSCSVKKADDSQVRADQPPGGEGQAVVSREGPVQGAPDSPAAGEPERRGKANADSPSGEGGRWAGPVTAPEAAPARDSRAYEGHSRKREGCRPVPPCPGPVRPGNWQDDEFYRKPGETGFLNARSNPLSTFSVDVDTASYANVRRFINQGTLPPREAVRIEEIVNYFDYDYPEPSRGKPFGASVEVARAPWAPAHKLVRVAIKARKADAEARKPSNLVFLLDVSGSMAAANKLPLVKRSILMLVNSLDYRDRVAIVTYASSAGVALESTTGDRKGVIREAVERLRASGSTAGGQGIQLAYSMARENMVRGGANRIILCTDGDFNVGVTDDRELKRMVAREAKSGVFLTVLGFGMGNLKDSRLETLADHGNGSYGYVDNDREARKHMVDQVQGTLVTVAKDVKLQVEFNPARVGSYRLIGYENRTLRNEDFANDRKDAGDVGAGHRVTAFYEVVPAGAEEGGDEGLRYGGAGWRRPEGARMEEEPVFGGELLFVKIRYKEPDGTESRLLEFPVADTERGFDSASRDLKFAAAAAEFGLVLGESAHRGSANLNEAYRIACSSVGRDEKGYRREFLQLVAKAERLYGSSWREGEED